MISVFRLVLIVALAAAQLVAIPVRPWLNPGISDPRNLANLAAWYDASDTSSMLAINGTQITDGGAVALWGDKSGNSGVNCLVKNDTAVSNYVETPHVAALDGATELDIKLRVAPSAYSAGSLRSMLGQYFSTGDQRQFLAGLNGSTPDYLALAISTLGTAATVNYAYSSQTVPYSALQAFWLRITWRGSDQRVQFFTAADQATEPSSWTQLGTNITMAGGATALPTSTAKFTVGSIQNNDTGNVPGRYYYASVATAIDGAAAVKIDFSTAGKKLANGDTFVCATGQTVTLNSSGATGARIAGERDLFQGTLANRPVYLNYAGTKYGYLNAVSGNYFSSPESTVLDGATELEVTVCFSPNALGINSVLWAKAQGAEYTGYLLIDAGNSISFVLSTDGTSGGRATVTKAPNTAFVVGVPRYVRATWRASDGRVQIFDGATIAGLTQAGTNGTIAMANLYNSTVPFEVGSRAAGTANPAGARIYSCEVCATIGGAAVQSFNPALYTSGTTFTASTGEVWTINGGAHIVTRTGLYFDGSNDYLKTAAFSLSQPETVYFTGEQLTFIAYDYITDGFANNGGTISQGGSSGQTYIYAGSAAATVAGSLKTPFIDTAVFNGASSSNRINRGSIASGNPGSNNMNGFTLGSNGSGGVPAAIFVSEVAIYSAAHPTATQNSVALYEIIKWDIVE